jgi:oligosaccharide repeat unit polymerase
MTAFFAMVLPVSIFVLQMGISILLSQSVAGYYELFLGSYLISFVIGYLMPRSVAVNSKWNPDRDAAINAFLVVKGFVVVYFGLIFAAYFSANGYQNVREYMTSDQLQGSPLYFAPLMYVDAYILYPLNYIVLISLYLRRRWRAFWFLIACIFLHTAVFYASRIIFYNALMLLIFGALHARVSLRKILAYVTILGAVGLAASLIIAFNRDAHLNYSDQGSLDEALITGVLFYHLVPPLILNAIHESSTYFNSHTGFGLATFGFLTDPILSLLPVADPRSLMASKMLSAEAQNFLLVGNGLTYNAFTTFLYAAIFDFGWLGPVIYGSFFGAGIGYAFRRRDNVGFMIFVIFSYFVYFNAFTSFITGDWFWVMVFSLVCFRRGRNGATAVAGIKAFPG